MKKIIDAKGLACPEPVIRAKRGIEENGEIMIIVDNKTAKENVSRLGNKLNCDIDVIEKDDDIFEISLFKKDFIKDDADTIAVEKIKINESISGPNVFVIKSDKMGLGDDDLGVVLMKAFIHTIFDLDFLPDKILLYNSGVKFAVKDSDTIDDLKELESRGVDILICGTCTDFFEITEKIDVGIISNMYDISSIMNSAGRLVTP